MIGVLPAHAASYVGSEACKDCHAGEYERFMKHSKKARSWQSVSRMAPKLTAEELAGCFACHTTGYGKGGFVSHDATPHLSDVGCESCHGPGGDHAASGDASSIAKPDMKTCERCHDESRVRSFGYKPLMHSGAH